MSTLMMNGSVELTGSELRMLELTVREAGLNVDGFGVSEATLAVLCAHGLVSFGLDRIAYATAKGREVSEQTWNLWVMPADPKTGRKAVVRAIVPGGGLADRLLAVVREKELAKATSVLTETGASRRARERGEFGSTFMVTLLVDEADPTEALAKAFAVEREWRTMLACERYGVGR